MSHLPGSRAFMTATVIYHAAGCSSATVCGFFLPVRRRPSDYPDLLIILSGDDHQTSKTPNLLLSPESMPDYDKDWVINIFLEWWRQ